MLLLIELFFHSSEIVIAFYLGLYQLLATLDLDINSGIFSCSFPALFPQSSGYLFQCSKWSTGLNTESLQLFWNMIADTIYESSALSPCSGSIKTMNNLATIEWRPGKQILQLLQGMIVGTIIRSPALLCSDSINTKSSWKGSPDRHRLLHLGMVSGIITESPISWKRSLVKYKLLPLGMISGTITESPLS